MMYELSFTGFIRTTLIVLLAYYSIRFISRLFLKKPPSNSDRMKNKGRDKTNKGGNNDLGEYIDFEEVKED